MQIRVAVNGHPYLRQKIHEFRCRLEEECAYTKEISNANKMVRAFGVL